ncbi:MAG: precorrin-2 C(20)-methyltransferase, partial [Nitrospinota bacterium]
VLKNGDDACFLTLGDSLLYSTYIYLVRALRELMPEAEIETVPGVTAFSGVAALTNFPVGEAKDPVTIVPASDGDLGDIRRALRGAGTVVLMKIGKCLHEVLDILEEENVIDNAVFVAYAGQEKQRIETDLRKLKNEKPETGYLSTILVRANGNGDGGEK